MEKNISNIKSRIIKYAEYKGISKRKIYIDTGISNGVLDKSTGLTEDNIDKFISTYGEINIEWLITGSGQMLRNQKPLTTLTDVPLLGIPLVTEEAVMGPGNDVFSISGQDIQAYYQVPDFNGIDFMIRVKGNSMYPKYSSGDIIACKILHEQRFIQWNKPHLVATGEQGLIVKRLRKSEKEKHIKAVSDNKDYDAFDIPEEDIKGIAIIVGVIRLE